MSIPGSLADPTGSSALLVAVTWLNQTLLGTIATTVATIAVASVGAMMLAGTIELRRGVAVICGCFLLVGATSIAVGIRLAAGSTDSVGVIVESDRGSPLPAALAQLPPESDPYAGAAVPRR